MERLAPVLLKLRSTIDAGVQQLRGDYYRHNEPRTSLKRFYVKRSLVEWSAPQADQTNHYFNRRIAVIDPVCREIQRRAHTSKFCELYELVNWSDSQHWLNLLSTNVTRGASAQIGQEVLGCLPVTWTRGKDGKRRFGHLKLHQVQVH